MVTLKLSELDASSAEVSMKPRGLWLKPRRTWPQLWNRRGWAKLFEQSDPGPFKGKPKEAVLKASDLCLTLKHKQEKRITPESCAMVKSHCLHAFGILVRGCKQ